MRSKRLVLLITLFLALILPALARAAEPLFNNGLPIEIDADFITYEKETETYYARGSVEIRQEGVTLRTDEIILDMASGVATAKGKVTAIDEGGSTLTGVGLTFDIKTKTAVITNARIFYAEEGIYIAGRVVEKTGTESYSAKEVTYTACECEEGASPAWSFAATSADVTFGEFLTGWNTRFQIKGVPVFYFPYVTVPVKRERQTGFLPTEPGFSELRGFVLDNSFFWAISESADATFYLDIETKRGIGVGSEYRYFRTAGSYGEAFLYHFSENDIGRVREFREDVDNLSRPETASNDRWRIKYRHTELLSDFFNIKADINVVSDDEYFLDFGAGGDERSLESIESNVSVTKSWNGYSLVGQLRVFNNLLDADDSETLQRLPEVTLAGSDKRILNTPFYFSSESSFVNFYREEGAEGDRLDIHPRVSLPMSINGYADFTVSVAPRGTFYLVRDHPGGGYMDRFLYDVQADLTTTFVRVFQTGSERLSAVKHTIRPKLSYTYIPGTEQTDLPDFDSVDEIAKTNSVTYSVNSTLTGKLRNSEGGSLYRDYLYFDLSQTFDINEATREGETEDDKKKPFKEITGELIVKPTAAMSVTGKGKYDVYESLFSSFDASFAASTVRGDALSLAYRFVRDSTSYLEASARVRLTEPLDFIYLNRYSYEEYRSLEASYGFEYRHQCWSAQFGYTDRLEEKLLFVTFNLKGLGKLAGFEGSLTR